MPGSLERPTRDDAGQALTEYAILLALVAGLHWLGVRQALERPATISILCDGGRGVLR